MNRWLQHKDKEISIERFYDTGAQRATVRLEGDNRRLTPPSHGWANFEAHKKVRAYRLHPIPRVPEADLRPRRGARFHGRLSPTGHRWPWRYPARRSRPQSSTCASSAMSGGLPYPAKLICTVRGALDIPRRRLLAMGELSPAPGG